MNDQKKERRKKRNTGVSDDNKTSRRGSDNKIKPNQTEDRKTMPNPLSLKSSRSLTT
jgi:hypothetical protein